MSSSNMPSAHFTEMFLKDYLPVAKSWFPSKTNYKSPESICKSPESICKSQESIYYQSQCINHVSYSNGISSTFSSGIMRSSSRLPC